MADINQQPSSAPRSGTGTETHLSQREQILGGADSADGARAKIPAKWLPYYDLLLQLRDQRIDAATDLKAKAGEIAPDPLQDSPAEIGSISFHRDQLLGAVTFDDE